MPGEQIDQSAMRQADPLGDAGRAGSIDDIDQVLRIDLTLWLHHALLSNQLPIPIEQDGFRLIFRQRRAQSALGQQQREMCIDKQKREALLRIGQEAVTNTVKHADANSIKIELDFSGPQIVLEIKDDGKGFAPESSPGPNDGHFGLLGMSERAKRLGGQIAVTSAPGSGTVIRVEIPVQRSETQQPINEQTDYEENVADSNTYR